MDETKFSLDICCICLENILIPVEPVCFQCKDQDDGKMSCFSMKRVCLSCLESYLDLHKHRYERPMKKKCLFCPKIAYLHQTPKNKLFRVDYLCMDKDTMVRKCPMAGCDFQDSHIKVAKHIFSECPLYHIDCECGFSCMRRDMNEHYKICDKFTFCSLCHVFIVKAELAQHMYYEHDKTKCFTCHQFINMNDLSLHILSKCPERLITCEICNTFIRFKLLKNHLRRHVVEISKNVQMIKNKLREEESSFHHIQKLINQIPNENQEHEGFTIL